MTDPRDSFDLGGPQPGAAGQARPLLVSACLAGWLCRYDGLSRARPEFVALVQNGQAIPFCPEMAGGLPVPRPPAEIVPDRRARATGKDPGQAVWEGQGRVLTQSGQDVTEAYRQGARQAAAVARAAGVRQAVLKEGSPSCGVHQIHDGSHTGLVVRGQGVTTAALRQEGIEVYSDEEWQGRQSATRVNSRKNLTEVRPITHIR
ncbi:MAG: DUF523 domain-containing protein, partial [Limnochordaceae bacterium]|nr:DUF523 domain-containing protein [Limnochordaceae bacterium]